MELVLIRHGKPETVIAANGPADPPLDANGRRQAELLRDYLVPEGIDAIWSSPMRRALETAAPLAEALALDVTVHPDIAEWDKNSNDYIPVEDLKKARPDEWKALMDGEWSGEGDPLAFQKGVIDAMEQIIATYPGQRVAVTCHGGVINAYLDHILNVGRPTGFFQPDYTSIHRIMASSRGHRNIRAVNEVGHLRGLGLLPERY